MASFNTTTIVGFLGRDPELRALPSGQSVCNLSIATTEKIKDKDHTTWFRVTVWGRVAELCSQYLAKGSQVYVQGRLRQEEYTDRDGNKRYTLEVNAADVQFIGRKGENGGEERGSAPAQKVTKQEVAQAIQESQDSEIPF